MQGVTRGRDHVSIFGVRYRISVFTRVAMDCHSQYGLIGIAMNVLSRGVQGRYTYATASVV